MKRNYLFLILWVILSLFINSLSFAGSNGTLYPVPWNYSLYDSSYSYNWNQPYSYGWNQPYSYGLNYGWNQPYGYAYSPFYQGDYFSASPAYPSTYHTTTSSYGGSNYTTVTGRVVGPNTIQANKGQEIRCWVNSMVAGVGATPLDLSEYMGLEVELSGDLQSNTLYSAQFEKTVSPAYPSTYQNTSSYGGSLNFTTVTGRVVGPSSIQVNKGQEIRCWVNSRVAGFSQPLDLSEYMGLEVELSGDLQPPSALYSAKFEKTVY